MQATLQMSRVHHLDDYDPNIAVGGYKVEHVVLNVANCLEFTSMNILSETITSRTCHLDATLLYQC